MKKHLLSFVKNFFYCGIAGWCMEIIFTALHSLRRRNFKLQGTTSLWMFPIYGMSALLNPVCHLLKKRPCLLRGTLYALLIYITEYVTGTLLARKDSCPWDYKHSKWHINSFIRLDYFPIWIVTGLIMEKILRKQDH